MQLNKSNFGGIINNANNPLSWLISISIVTLLLAQPIFFFSISGWATRIGIATYLLCLIALIYDRPPPKSETSTYPQLYWWIIFSLSTFFLATAISQVANQTFTPNRLDSPSRLLFSTLIFYAIYKYRIDFVKILKISIPLSLFFLLLYIEFNSKQIELAKSFWGGRLSLPFIDPILLSAWLTCFGLLSLSFFKSDFQFFTILKNVIFIASSVISIYIGLSTQSRTGWLAIPIVITILMFRPSNTWIKVFYLAIASAAIIYFANTISTTGTRIDQAILELKNFLTGDLKESSVGIRLDMGNLALKALSWKPFFGWGESLFTTPEIKVYLSSHFTPSTLHLGQHTGFHNDLYAAIVRSGSLGIFAYASTFLTPLFLFLYLFFKGDFESKLIASKGLAVIITCIISSMTVEILAYKYSVTIFSYLISGLMAQALWINQGRKSKMPTESINI